MSGRVSLFDSAVTRDKVLHTNDRVVLQPDGSFLWLGRVDNVINSGGVKVQVEKVERVLEEVLFAQSTNCDELGLPTRRFFIGPLSDMRLGQPSDSRAGR